MSKEINAFKGFDKNMQCRGFQYEVGKSYEHDGEVEKCGSGFHACEHPLDVFVYYPPATSRFATVVLSGETDKGEDKIAAAKIHIEAELPLHQYIEAAINWVFARAKKVKGCHTRADRKAASATGYHSAASATGSRGAASATGSRGAASATGDWSAASATGDWSAASATGYQSAASATGYQSAASATGYQSAASATGDQSAASATGNWSAASATGDQSAASATGNWSAASATGYQSAASATGDWSAAMASGYDGKVKGKAGNALFLVERNDDYQIIATWSGIAGKYGVKADTWYKLVNGKLEEA